MKQKRFRLFLIVLANVPFIYFLLGVLFVEIIINLPSDIVKNLGKNN